MANLKVGKKVFSYLTWAFFTRTTHILKHGTPWNKLKPPETWWEQILGPNWASQIVECPSYKLSRSSNTIAVIWKSLRVLQKACIKIVAHAIYTYLFFSDIYTLLFCWKIKSCFDCCFPHQIRPQTTVQSYILRLF